MGFFGKGSFWAKMGRLCYASCFMLIWFNGQCLMREGLRICGLAKPFPPNSYVIISRIHHTTPYTLTLYTNPVLMRLCIVRILSV